MAYHSVRLRQGTVGHWVNTAPWEEIASSGLLWHINSQRTSNEIHAVFEEGWARLKYRLARQNLDRLQHRDRQQSVPQLYMTREYPKLLRRVLHLPDELISQIYSYATEDLVHLDIVHHDLVSLMSKCYGHGIFAEELFKTCRFSYTQRLFNPIHDIQHVVIRHPHYIPPYTPDTGNLRQIAGELLRYLPDLKSVLAYHGVYNYGAGPAWYLMIPSGNKFEITLVPAQDHEALERRYRWTP